MFFINTLLYVSVGLMNLQFGERLSLEPRILSIRHEYPCLILQVLCNMKREAYQYFLSLHHAEIVENMINEGHLFQLMVVKISQTICL